MAVKIFFIILHHIHHVIDVCIYTYIYMSLDVNVKQTLLKVRQPFKPFRGLSTSPMVP